ncbi:hypothetical protein KIW84_020556 [Lathyrus oleraceus]|uniref:tRNAHis guanylyltransferase catalytic domain-containing protein n=1 Tax=Pisum sativum TaxID=3888 RepID=A0A9D4Y609_PEA|nr:hypothetical protein KIW84_020556 [Pisum sativum]
MLLSKPYDVNVLNFMNSCAFAVLEEFRQDVVFAYGVNDECSFILKNYTDIYERRAKSPRIPHGGLVMSEITKSEPSSSVQSEYRMPKTKNKSNGYKTKFGDDKDRNTLLSRLVKRKRLCPANQKRTTTSEMSASA